MKSIKDKIEELVGRKVEVSPSQEDYPDPKEGDTAVLVCAYAGPSTFTDNVFASCETCGKAVMHRPHVPKGCQILCGPCAFGTIAKAEAGGDEVKMVVTQKTVDEVEAWSKGNG